MYAVAEILWIKSIHHYVSQVICHDRIRFKVSLIRFDSDIKGHWFSAYILLSILNGSESGKAMTGSHLFRPTFSHISGLSRTHQAYE
jgi:hypothetical protein